MLLGRRLIGLVGVLAILACAFGTSSAFAAQVGAPSDKLQVWNLNTGTMSDPAFDHYEFIAYITDPARAAYLPDIITLQEVGRPATDPSNSCHRFADDLRAATGSGYNCYESSFQGGAGIVYRTARLSYQAGSYTPFTLYENVDGPDPDDEPDGCKLDADNDPWTALAIRLKDDVNGKFVNVASLHTWTTCTWDNVRRADSKIDGLGTASMRIMAGDLNREDADHDDSTFNFWECWYKGTNVDLTAGACSPSLSWKDPMYKDCWQGGTATPAVTYSCIHANHRSTGRRRIDFLFVKAYAIYDQVTASWADADAYDDPPDSDRYSDHMGQGALLKYY